MNNAAPLACAGAVFKLDMGDGKSRPWIILNDPDSKGLFLAVSWTDRRAFQANDHVWRKGRKVSPIWAIEKDSVLQVKYTKLRKQGWIDEHYVEYCGVAFDPILGLARCNLVWNPELLETEIAGFLDWFLDEWDGECWQD